MRIARLKTLGATELRDAEGHEIGSVVQQPRRFALLVYLAVEGRGGMLRRDQVLATFWPERSDEQGRAALSQALHYLRRSLGAGCIETRGNEELRVSEAHVACDAVAFMRAVDAGDRQGALAVYDGDFLPAFHCSAPVAFEAWLDRTRSKLRRSAAVLAFGQAEEDMAARRAIAAGSAARRALDLTRDDEAMLRRVMALLGRLGDRAGALSAYDDFATHLKRDLDAVPASETRALAEAVRAMGGQMAQAPVGAPGNVAGGELVAGRAALAGTPGRRAEDRRRRPALWRPTLRWGFSIVSTVTLAAALYSVWGTRNASRVEPLMDHLKLWLTPVQSFPASAGHDAVGAALRAELISRLGGSSRFELLAAAGAGARSQATRGTGAGDYALETAVVRTGRQWQVYAAVSDRATGRTVQSARFQETVTDTGRALSRLSLSVADFARRAMGQDLRRRDVLSAATPLRARQEVLSAHAATARSDSLRIKGVVAVARLDLEQADSQLALAQRQAPDWSYPPAERAKLGLRRMWLDLTPPSPSMSRARHDLIRALPLVDRALLLAPADPGTREISGTLGYWLWATTPLDSVAYSAGFLARAERGLKAATAAGDGASGNVWNLLSAIQFAHGAYAQSYLSAERALASDAFLTGGTEVRIRLFSAALETGDTASARRWCSDIGGEPNARWWSSYCQLTMIAWQPTPSPGALERVPALIRSAGTGAMARSQSPYLAALQGIILAGANHRAEARTRLAPLTEAAKANPELLPYLAWLRERLGDLAGARADLDRYVRAWPEAREGVALSARFDALNRRPPTKDLVANSRSARRR